MAVGAASGPKHAPARRGSLNRETARVAVGYYQKHPDFEMALMVGAGKASGRRSRCGYKQHGAARLVRGIGYGAWVKTFFFLLQHPTQVMVQSQISRVRAAGLHDALPANVSLHFLQISLSQSDLAN